MAFQTTKEKFNALNSLTCFVQALESNLITIDLENEMCVTGFVREVDGYMNVTLEKAQLVNLDGYCHHYDIMYVAARNIRFIHLPKELSVRETILKFLRKNRRTGKTTTALQRHRINKLQKYQEETRQNVAKLKELATSMNP